MTDEPQVVLPDSFDQREATQPTEVAANQVQPEPEVVVVETDVVPPSGVTPEPAKENRNLVGAIMAAGVIFLLLFVAVIWSGINAYQNAMPKSVTASIETTATAVVSNEKEPAPLREAGVHSWTEWCAVATPQMWAALKSVTGVTPEEAKKWAAEEGVMGKDFKKELPAGTSIVNSSIKADQWYVVKTYHVKPGDTLFLATDKGVVAVKVSCGNPVAVKTEVAENTCEETPKEPCSPKPEPKPPCPEPKPKPKPKAPCDPAWDSPDNPTYQNPPDPGRTPGITPEEHREVVDSRGTGPDTSGTPATGDPTVDEGSSGGVYTPPPTGPVDPGPTGNDTVNTGDPGAPTN